MNEKTKGPGGPLYIRVPPIMLLTLYAFALPGLAVAADDEGQQSAAPALQEVVVTAMRRSESLQDVPVAITALSGNTLGQLHLQGTADLASQVPSFSFSVLGPGETTLAIRGLSTSYGLAPTVSYYLNEIPLDIRTDGYAGAPDIDFFDVNRIEVLRGPQGTLYGASSMGGAVRVLTNQPDPKAMGITVETGASSMHGGGAGYLAKSAVNLPISADAAVRLVGTYEHVPGYINRVTPGDYSVAQPNDTVTAHRINDADLEGGRILASWQPTAALKISPSFVISEVDAASNSNYMSNLPLFSVAATSATPQRSRLSTGNLQIDYDIGPASLMSSTSVISMNVDATNDFTLFFSDLAPAFGLTYPPDYPGDDLTTSHNSGVVQEFRLTSRQDQRLRYIAGIYYSRYRQHSTEQTGSDAFAAAIGQTTGPNLYGFDQSVVDQQSAVYADLTYDISRVLSIAAGERYYRLRDSLENAQEGVLAAPNQPLVHASASGSSPRVVLTYKPYSGHLLYFSASRGYRPGGPNVGLPTGAGCALTNAYEPLYQPDSVWNYEIGAKMEGLQHRLSIDVDGYRIDWKNVQQAVTDPVCGSLFVANVGSARSQGTELEIKYRPIESLVLNASGSYTRATFESIAGPLQGASAVQPGDPVPDVPRWKWNLGAEYLRPINGNLTGYLNADWSHLGVVPTGFTFSAFRPAYSSVDLSIGARTEHYDVSVYMHNLGNTTGILSISRGTGDSFGDIFDTRIATPPRVIGLDLTFHY